MRNVEMWRENLAPRLNLKCNPARDVDRRRDPEGDAPLFEGVARVEQESGGEGRQDPRQVGHRVREPHDDAGVQGSKVQHAEGEEELAMGNFGIGSLNTKAENAV